MTTTYILLGVLMVLLLLFLTTPARESFQVIQAVPTSENQYSNVSISTLDTLDNELASVIDPNAPDGTDAINLQAVTVNATQMQQLVNDLITQINSSTNFTFALVKISNAKKQVDSGGTQYFSVIFTAHDMSRFFTREIGANLTLTNVASTSQSVMTMSQLYVQSVGFLNSMKDTSNIVGVLDVASQQTYCAFPSVWDW